MRRLPVFPVAALLLPAALVPAARAQAPAPGDVVINEVMYDPPASQGTAANEWIELYNRSTQTFDLAQFAVGDASTATPAALPSRALAPGAYVVVANDGAQFAAAYPGVDFVDVPALPTLNNDTDRPRLLVGATEIDAVPYTSAWGGADASLERRDPDGPSDAAANWGTTTDPALGTPGRRNSLFVVDATPPELLSATALDATTVEVSFSEAVVVEAGDYSVSDGVGAPAAAAPVPDDPTRVRLTLATPLTGPRTYTLTVTDVADPAGNTLAMASTTFFFGQFDTPAAREIVINEVMYDPPAPQPSSNEWVELHNRTDRPFDLAALRFADAADTVAVATATTVLPPGGYVVLVRNASAFAAAFPGVPHLAVPGFPNLNNDTDAPALLDGAAVIDRVPYRTSWGGVDASLERRDPGGPSAFAGNWGTTADPARGTPGRQNSLFAPDTDGPTIVAVEVSARADRLTVTFDLPLDPATVVPASFTLTGPSAPAVAGAAYDDSAGDPTVVLALAAPLEPGAFTLDAPGVRDTQGRTGTAPPFTFTADPDQTPPAVDAAVALDATTVEVTFSEPVTDSAADPARYSVSGGIGTPASVAFPADGDARRARLTLAAPLQERTLYTLTVSGIEDPAGNVLQGGTAALFFGEADAPEPGDLVVNEILFDPLEGSAGEYVELYNRSPRTLDLRRIGLTDGPAADADPISDVPVIVAPGAFAVVVADRDSFATRFPGVPAVEAADFPSLNNTGDAVVVAYQGAAIDSVFFDPGWHRVELDDATGIALERRDPAGDPNSRLNWSSSLAGAGGTPGAANSVTTVPGTPPGEAGLTFSQSPFDPDAGQATSIAYTLATDAAVVRVRIYDAAGRLVRRIEDGRLTGRTGALPWDGRGDDGRALRIGIYVVLLEAVDVEGGAAEAHRGAVVLARRF